MLVDLASVQAPCAAQRIIWPAQLFSVISLLPHCPSLRPGRYKQGLLPARLNRLRVSEESQREAVTGHFTHADLPHQGARPILHCAGRDQHPSS
jgi:hypothetical protein